MGKIQIEFSWNNQEEGLKKILTENKLTHLKSHKDDYLKVGDALRSEKGVIARVVKNVPASCKDCFVLANKNVSSEELRKQFLNETWTFTSDTVDDVPDDVDEFAPKNENGWIY